MKSFNNGRPYHGSRAVKNGRLKGATGFTDYFFFFCPTCPDDHIVRILDCELHDMPGENPKNKLFERKAAKAFRLALKIYCENCKKVDFVKIDNTGVQSGPHKNLLYK